MIVAGVYLKCYKHWTHADIMVFMFCPGLTILKVLDITDKSISSLLDVYGIPLFTWYGIITVFCFLHIRRRCHHPSEWCNLLQLSFTTILRSYLMMQKALLRRRITNNGQFSFWILWLS